MEPVEVASAIIQTAGQAVMSTLVDTTHGVVIHTGLVTHQGAVALSGTMLKGKPTISIISNGVTETGKTYTANLLDG